MKFQIFSGVIHKQKSTVRLRRSTFFSLDCHLVPQQFDQGCRCLNGVMLYGLYYRNYVPIGKSGQEEEICISADCLFVEGNNFA